MTAAVLPFPPQPRTREMEAWEAYRRAVLAWDRERTPATTAAKDAAYREFVEVYAPVAKP